MSTLYVPAVCAIGFAQALFASHWLDAPPLLYDPVCPKHLGRCLYLTYHSNVMGLLYFGAATFEGATGALGPAALLRFFPLVFGAEAFMTIAYFALDHGNPENFRRKERNRKKYPHVHLCSWLQHAHALPLVLLHAYTVELAPPAELPLTPALGFMAYYLALVHANWLVTGRWPYAVVDDVERAGGWPARCAFFLALAGAFVGFAAGGVALLKARP